MKRLLAGGAIACLAACATAPENIAARSDDTLSYVGQTCAQLEATRAQTESSLPAVEAAQRRTRRVDAVGLALVLLPVGSLIGGNHAKEIANLKGREEELSQEMLRERCTVVSGGRAPVAHIASPQG